MRADKDGTNKNVITMRGGHGKHLRDIKVHHQDRQKGNARSWKVVLYPCKKLVCTVEQNECMKEIIISKNNAFIGCVPPVAVSAVGESVLLLQKASTYDRRPLAFWHKCPSAASTKMPLMPEGQYLIPLPRGKLSLETEPLPHLTPRRTWDHAGSDIIPPFPL